MKLKYFILTIVLLSVIIMGRAEVTPPMGVVDGDSNTYELVNFTTDGDTPGLEIYDQDQNNSIYLTTGDIFTIDVINATVGEKEQCDINLDCFYVPDAIEVKIQFEDFHQVFVYPVYLVFFPVYTGIIITTDLEYVINYYTDNNYPGDINITETEDTVTVQDSYNLLSSHHKLVFEGETTYDKQTGWMLTSKYTITMDEETFSVEMRSIGNKLEIFGILEFELPIVVLTVVSIVMLKRFRPKENN